MRFMVTSRHAWNRFPGFRKSPPGSWNGGPRKCGEASLAGSSLLKGMALLHIASLRMVRYAPFHRLPRVNQVPFIPHHRR